MDQEVTEANFVANASNSNATNIEVPLIKVIHDVLVLTVVLAVMFAMGCVITLKELLTHMKRPIGVCIGMASQFVLLPLTTFCFILILGIESMHGAGMLLVSCSPGGVTSNIFTYLSLGDVPLSVTMTSCSTLLAMGMMPLNMWIYGRYLENGTIVIPYGKIGLSLLFVTAPVTAGMLLKYKYPRVAHYCAKVGTFAGITIILLIQILESLIFPNIFRRIQWTLYLSVGVLPFFTLFLGYGLAWACRQSHKTCRTVAIECSIQNISIAVTVISLSFPFKVQQDVIAFAYLYPIPMIITALVCIAVYRLVKKKFKRKRENVVTNGNRLMGKQLSIVTEEEEERKYHRAIGNHSTV